MNDDRENMTIFDFLPEETEALPCDTCRHDAKGCCDYDEPLGRACVLGNAYEPQSDEVYGYTYRRNGEKRPLTEHEKTWMWDQRCETCKCWSIYMKDDQPPDGWGVFGLCSHWTAEEHKEYKTGGNSYCNEYTPITPCLRSIAKSRYEDDDE